MRQERLPAAGRRPRAGVKQRQQGSGGVGSIISNVLKKRNGISRSAPRLLCTLEPGDPAARSRDCASILGFMLLPISSLLYTPLFTIPLFAFSRFILQLLATWRPKTRKLTTSSNQNDILNNDGPIITGNYCNSVLLLHLGITISYSSIPPAHRGLRILIHVNQEIRIDIDTPGKMV